MGNKQGTDRPGTHESGGRSWRSQRAGSESGSSKSGRAATTQFADIFDRNKSEVSAATSKKASIRMCGVQLSGRYHLLPKKLTDDYMITSHELGSGFSGKVYQAVSKTNRENHFAVKSFNIQSLTSAKKSQLESEIEIFLVMDHPHVARLIDVYETEDRLELVMECMEGGELFDRVTEIKRFNEKDAADAVWQMLLALNYIHSHDIVHRDLKLENFLYERKDGRHLKLIDFGFSKIWDNVAVKMQLSCGTLSYVAPEVLQKNYTSQCDLWSLGVLTFIILSGYMPFHGDEKKQTSNILEGRYVLKTEKWDPISAEGKDFTKRLLMVNPNDRLTAAQALKHSWIDSRQKMDTAPNIDRGVVEAMRQYRNASKFRRSCMEMMAWSLSTEDRSKVREYFIAMDTSNSGTVTLTELRKVLVDKFELDAIETKEIFNALDTNGDEEIHYSDFLAAMVSTRIALHDDLLRSAFKKFDTDNSGYITTDNLKQVLGETFGGQDISDMLAEADQLEDGRISYAEFVAYLRGAPLDQHQEAVSMIIDHQVEVVHAGRMRKTDRVRAVLRRKDSDDDKRSTSSRRRRKRDNCALL